MSIYDGKVKVVGLDMMCFPADPETLNAISCGCYDPYAWADPQEGPVETICVSEWQIRRAAMARQEGER